MLDETAGVDPTAVSPPELPRCRPGGGAGPVSKPGARGKLRSPLGVGVRSEAEQTESVAVEKVVVSSSTTQSIPGRLRASGEVEVDGGAPSAGPAVSTELPQQLGAARLDQLPLPLRLRACLDQWRKIGAPELVLGWIRDGVHIWPRRQEWLMSRQGRNKFKSAKEKAWAVAELERLTALGAARRVPRDQVSLVSGLRLVPKEPGSEKEERWYRMVIRQMALNECVPKRPFKLETWRMLVEMVSPGWFAASMDIARAYQHVPVADDSLKWMAVQVDEQCWVMSAITFGYSLSPWIFCRIIKAVAAYIRAQWVGRQAVVSFYFDDLTVAAESEDLAKELEDFVRSLLTGLGFLMMEAKRKPVAQRIEHLGVVLDTVTGRARLAKGKGSRYVARLTETAGQLEARLSERRGGTIHWRQLAMLVGQLAHAAATHRMLRIPLRPLVVRVWKAFDEFEATGSSACAALEICEDLVSELREAARVLCLWEERGTLVWRQAVVVELFSDASGVAGGGWGATCPSLGLSLSGRWPEEYDSTSVPVPLKELVAWRLGFQQWAPLLRARKVRARMDAAATVAIWNNGGARGDRRRYTVELRRIVALAEEFDVELCPPEWVSRDENTIADKLSKAHLWKPHWALPESRFDLGWRHDDWRCPIEWVRAGLAKAGKFALTCDAFASERTAQAARWFSPMPTIGAAGTGGETAMDWGEGQAVIWAAPPLRLAGLATQLARQARATVLLCVPQWPSQWWWPMIESLLRQPSSSSGRRASVFGSWSSCSAEDLTGSELLGNQAWVILGLVVVGVPPSWC